MRKQSQLADLIAGSGLVSGVSRRASSQDGHNAPAQPVLYHFGARAGSTSSKDRPPLPNGFSSSGGSSSAIQPSGSSGGGGRPPPGVAWSSPYGTPNTTVSNLSADATLPGSISTVGGMQSFRSSDAPPDSLSISSSAPMPLPQLSSQRPSFGPDPHDMPPIQAHLGSKFLPAVGGASDLGQPIQEAQPSLLSSSPGAAAGGTAAATGSAGSTGGFGAGPGAPQYDPRVGGGGSGGGAGVQPHGPASASLSPSPQQQSQWTFYGSPSIPSYSSSVAPSPDYGGDGRPLTPGGASGALSTSAGGGMADTLASAGAWQHLPSAHPHSAGGAEGGAGGSGGAAAAAAGGGLSPSRSLTSGGGGSSTPGRNAHSGGRVRACGGGGGGYSNKQRWGRPNSTTARGSTTAIHRSSSESSVRLGADAAGVALAMSVQGAWSANSTADSSGGGAAAGGGGGSGGGAASLRSSRLGALSPAVGSAELVVVEEEDSGGFEPTASGGVAAAVVRGSISATGAVAAGAANGIAAITASGTRQYGASAPHIASSGSLPSPYAGPSGAATAALAAAGVVAPGGGAGTGPLMYGGTSGPAGAGPGTAVPPLASSSTANELMELRRLVAELNGQVARLTSQLRDSELSAAQLQSMAAAAVVSEREAAELESARRHMKGLKAAEAARDRAEVARRGAEKRAKAAEEELAATKEKLEAKNKQVMELEAAVAAAQSSLEKQRKAHEEAMETLESQHKAQSRKQHQDMHSEKQAQQESMTKMQQDIAKRNQTVLALQADLEAAQEEGVRKDKQLEQLQQTVAQLQADLDRERDRMRWMAEAQAEVERQREARSDEAPPSPTGRSKTLHDTSDGTATPTPGGASSPPPAPATTSSSASPPPSAMRRGVSTLSATAAASAAGGGGGSSGGASGSGPLMDEQSRAIRKMQTEVAAIREDYARRLVEMDEVVASCEATMRDGVQGLERMFNVLVSRTAGILAGRLGSFKGVMPGAKGAARPGTPVSGAARGATAAAAAAAAAGASNAVLHMNERLAAENAQLLAELSRWQSGRHAMLRKLNMVVLGTDPPPPAPPPLTHQQKIAQALAAVTGGQHGGGGGGATAAASAGGGPAAAAPPPAAASGPKVFQYQQNFTGSPPPATGAGAAAADSAMTAAREALAAATRDSLLAGRKELLPAVMTAEGWGGAAVQGGWDANTAAQQLHGGKVESSLAAAESSLRLRTQLLALQAEVTRSRATGGEVVERSREREVMEEDHEAALLELKKELAAAKHQMSHMQRELERARAGINTAPDVGRSGAQDALERERLEEALSSARDDAARHKQVASAAKRDLEARERALEELQLRYERLEAQCRDARSEAQRQGEGVKRLRLLLAQAKSLLRDQGVPFMEDDPGLDLLLSGAGGQAGGGSGAAGGKAGKQQRPGSTAPDSDGPLFKALDAREREKETQRLQGEVADLAAQLAAANKELKKARKALQQQQEAAAAAEREQRLALASTIDALARDADAAKDSARTTQRQLQDSQHEAGELRRQIAGLNDQITRAKLDADYLRARAAAGKMKPKLTHARALSISISAAAASAPEG